MQLKQLTAATSLLVAGAAAQNSSSSGSGSGSSGGPTLMFNSTDLEKLNSSNSNYSLTTREAWCTGQRTACSKLCGDNTGSNGCNSSALTWDCTCGKNNSAPGLQWYGSSMPASICGALNGICMSAAASAADAQDAQANCNASYVCSNLNITTYGGSSSSGGASQTGSSAQATSSPSGTSSSGSSQSSKAAAAALHVSEQYGTALLGGTLFAALGLFL